VLGTVREDDMRRVILAVMLLAFAGMAIGEVRFKALSVTDTNQYWTLSKASASVMLCNTGANPAYYRLFDESDTPAAATTSYSLLPAGGPCISYGKGATAPFYYSTVSIIAGSGLTTTVNVYHD
jgi:hypothetical protein